MEFRTSSIEHRADADGVTVAGVALPYRHIAELPWGRERVERGAVRYADAGVFANLQHSRERPLGRHPGNLTLTDADDGLRFELRLPDTGDGRDAGTLVREGVLGGASVEFTAIRERFLDGVRILDELRLHAIALVDVPAYSAATIEARARHHQCLRSMYTARPAVAWLGV